MPTAVTRPDSRSTTESAARMVEGRWAMASRVHSAESRSMVRVSAASFAASNWEVGSSRSSSRSPSTKPSPVRSREYAAKAESTASARSTARVFVGPGGP
ncbi:hypothetical protein [Streptomyces amakusaensis]|uniref:Uncharacterized protein n=1 Tax=Streptomyces amakusaensis TaxID=67271 RepID=A0ABW0AEK5_9ACTN